MTLRARVLGGAGDDNALFVALDPGSGRHCMLFDSGQGCPDELPKRELRRLQYVFLSHFHVDHIAGFDGLIRFSAIRAKPPLQVWGPAGALETVHHRLRGVQWNLSQCQHTGEVIVHELGLDARRSARFLACEAFAVAHPMLTVEQGSVAVETGDFKVAWIALDHGTMTLGYRVSERDQLKVRTDVMRGLHIEPGPWLQAVVDSSVEDSTVVKVAGVDWVLRDLRHRITTTAKGASCAYLTDFRLNSDSELQNLAEWLQGCGALFCGCRYRAADADLAAKHNHITSIQAAELARRAGVDELILFHMSERYGPVELRGLLKEARAVFPATSFPADWALSR